jgi:hypothetical protein
VIHRTQIARSQIARNQVTRGSWQLTLLVLFVVPSLWTVGRWVQPGVGVDAVSAVTPGHVSVVGARELPENFDAAAADSLVRRALYFSGGIHKAFDADAQWILVRVAPEVTSSSQSDYLQVLESTLLALHDAADEAELALLVGTLDGGDDVWNRTIAQHLQSPRLASLNLEVLLVSEEETEAIDVPDSGLAADLYDLPIALLECDAVISIAHAQAPLAAMMNLDGLAQVTDAPPRPTQDPSNPHAVMVDLALLTEVSFTLTHLQPPGAPQMVLASRDGVAVDRVAAQIAGAASDSISVSALHMARARFLGQSDLADIKVSGVDVPGTWVEVQEED